MPAPAADGSRVASECGDRPYGEEGTAICEVGPDGSGFRVVPTPTDVPTGEAATGAVRHPDYAPDGALVSAASGDGKIWRLPAMGTAQPVGSAYENDNAPRVLPDDRIASRWLGRPEGSGPADLKMMAHDGASFVLLATGVNFEDIS